MIKSIHKKQSSLSRKILCGFVALTFLTGVILPPTPVSAQVILNLPVPGTMVAPSAGFMPLRLIGVTVHPENPLEFDFIVNSGDTNLSAEAYKEESRKLIKYFLASLTVPEDELWVNLSPYEKDRMVPQGLGATEMGRDMLAQDYLLKQLTASLMYPEKELGKKFWEKIYKEAREKYGTTEIPVNTFNKVWVVPQEAVVYEQGTSAYVVKSRLKVMLESDYEAMSHQVTKSQGHQKNITGDVVTGGLVTAQIIREVIVPAIEKEINEGENFANLRQMYNSLILAAWYKLKLKDGLLGKIYIDQNKTKGIDTGDKTVNQKIYDQYIESFKKGVYNYIKEDTDPATQDMIPRKYFSGGEHFNTPFVDNDIVKKKMNGFGNGIIALVFATMISGASIQPAQAADVMKAIDGDNNRIEVVLGEYPLKSAPETVAAIEPATFASDPYNKNLVEFGEIEPSPGQVTLKFDIPLQTNNNDFFLITFNAENVPKDSKVGVRLLSPDANADSAPAVVSYFADVQEGINKLKVQAWGKMLVGISIKVTLSDSRTKGPFSLNLKEVIVEKTALDQMASASSPVSVSLKIDWQKLTTMPSSGQDEKMTYSHVPFDLTDPAASEHLQVLLKSVSGQLPFELTDEILKTAKLLWFDFVVDPSPIFPAIVLQDNDGKIAIVELQENEADIRGLLDEDYERYLTLAMDGGYLKRVGDVSDWKRNIVAIPALRHSVVDRSKRGEDMRLQVIMPASTLDPGSGTSSSPVTLEDGEYETNGSDPKIVQAAVALFDGEFGRMEMDNISIIRQEYMRYLEDERNLSKAVAALLALNGGISARPFPDAITAARKLISWKLAAENGLSSHSGGWIVRYLETYLEGEEGSFAWITERVKNQEGWKNKIEQDVEKEIEAILIEAQRRFRYSGVVEEPALSVLSSGAGTVTSPQAPGGGIFYPEQGPTEGGPSRRASSPVTKDPHYQRMFREGDRFTAKTLMVDTSKFIRETLHNINPEDLDSIMRNNPTVMVLGFGENYEELTALAQEFPESKIIGIDWIKENIDLAREHIKNDNIILLQQDIRVPIVNQYGPAGLIFLSYVIDDALYNRDRQALAQILNSVQNLLAEDGFVVSVPANTITSRGFADRSFKVLRDEGPGLKTVFIARKASAASPVETERAFRENVLKLKNTDFHDLLKDYPVSGIKRVVDKAREVLSLGLPFAEYEKLVSELNYRKARTFRFETLGLFLSDDLGTEPRWMVDVLQEKTIPYLLNLSNAIDIFIEKADLIKNKGVRAHVMARLRGYQGLVSDLLESAYQFLDDLLIKHDIDRIDVPLIYWGPHKKLWIYTGEASLGSYTEIRVHVWAHSNGQIVANISNDWAADAGRRLFQSSDPQFRSQIFYTIVKGILRDGGVFSGWKDISKAFDSPLIKAVSLDSTSSGDPGGASSSPVELEQAFRDYAVSLREINFNELLKDYPSGEIQRAAVKTKVLLSLPHLSIAAYEKLILGLNDLRAKIFGSKDLALFLQDTPGSKPEWLVEVLTKETIPSALHFARAIDEFMWYPDLLELSPMQAHRVRQRLRQFKRLNDRFLDSSYGLLDSLVKEHGIEIITVPAIYFSESKKKLRVDTGEEELWDNSKIKIHIQSLSNGQMNVSVNNAWLTPYTLQGFDAGGESRTLFTVVRNILEHGMGISISQEIAEIVRKSLNKEEDFSPLGPSIAGPMLREIEEEARSLSKLEVILVSDFLKKRSPKEVSEVLSHRDVFQRYDGSVNVRRQLWRFNVVYVLKAGVLQKVVLGDTGELRSLVDENSHVALYSMEEPPPGKRIKGSPSVLASFLSGDAVLDLTPFASTLAPGGRASSSPVEEQKWENRAQSSLASKLAGFREGIKIAGLFTGLMCGAGGCGTLVNIGTSVVVPTAIEMMKTKETDFEASLKQEFERRAKEIKEHSSQIFYIYNTTILQKTTALETMLPQDAAEFIDDVLEESIPADYLGQSLDSRLHRLRKDRILAELAAISVIVKLLWQEGIISVPASTRIRHSGHFLGDVIEHPSVKWNDKDVQGLEVLSSNPHYGEAARKALKKIRTGNYKVAAQGYQIQDDGIYALRAISENELNVMFFDARREQESALSRTQRPASSPVETEELESKLQYGPFGELKYNGNELALIGRGGVNDIFEFRDSVIRAQRGPYFFDFNINLINRIGAKGIAPRLLSHGVIQGHPYLQMEKVVGSDVGQMLREGPLSNVEMEMIMDLLKAMIGEGITVEDLGPRSIVLGHISGQSAKQEKAYFVDVDFVDDQRFKGKEGKLSTQTKITILDGYVSILRNSWYKDQQSEIIEGLEKLRAILVEEAGTAFSQASADPSISLPIASNERQATKTAPGGIDLNPALLDLQIKRDGNGVPLPLPQQPIETMHIDGFVPIIINITPIPNLPMLLGLADTAPDTQQTKPDLKARELEVASYLN